MLLRNSVDVSFEERGKRIPSSLAPVVVAALHPAAVLRAPDDAARAVAFRL